MSYELGEHGRRLARSALAILGLVGLGVIGYLMLTGSEHDTLDALYMTMITLTTVGYGETIDLSTNPEGRIFTIILLIVGVGSFAVFFSNLTAFMVDGHFDRMLWKRKMKKNISTMKHHFIVCGGGSTAFHMIKELHETGRSFVVVESEVSAIQELSAAFGKGLAIVQGDATDDEALHQAGIERADGLAACVANDKDNLIITISAHLLNPDIRIVTRCIDPKLKEKMRKAGASAVVSPTEIGGLRIASEMIRPRVVSFLDVMLRDDKKLRVEELKIPLHSSLLGSTVGSLRKDAFADFLLLALRRPNDEWLFNPAKELQFNEGDTLVFMATPEGRSSLLQRINS